MRRLALALGMMSLLGQAGGGLPANAQLHFDPRVACLTGFAVTAVAGDPNAVVMRVLDFSDPPRGKITAYGHDRTWTGTIERTAMTQQYGVREWSTTVRAEAPIEAIAYEVEGGSCTLRGGTRSRYGYDAPDVPRPEAVVSGAQPIEPATCARPYASASVTRAVDPRTPALAAQQGIVGTVRVGVALDERGVPQSAQIISSPAAILNGASLDAARSSTYSGAVFRCMPVRSAYQFSVHFSP